MKVFFNQLFDYNFFCNKRFIEECKVLKNLPDKSISLFSHILNAHHLWNARLQGKMPAYETWQLQPMKEWSDIHYENQRNTFEIITNTDNFEQRIDYENSEGRMFTNTVKDILFHVINHSTHHRAQIAMDMRNNKLEPLPLDYIFYKR
jgi:uncharacterized damage-inducible protein DinB